MKTERYEKKTQVEINDSHNQGGRKVNLKTEDPNEEMHFPVCELKIGGWCAPEDEIPKGGWRIPEDEIPKGGWRGM